MTSRAFPRRRAIPSSCPAAPLRDTINRVARAASRDEARPVLTGVLVTVEGDEMTMVATDSYRLAVKKTKLESSVPERLEANVPARALRELARLIEAGGEDSLSVWLTRNQAIFRVGQTSLSSRLIDGQFPNHSQLLPESYEHEVKLPRAELLEVTRRVSQLAQRNAALRLSFSDGRAGGLRRDAGPGGRPRGPAGALLRASCSRSASTPSSSGTGWRASSPTRCCSS